MLYWIALAALTFPVFVVLCRMAFRDLDSFVEAIVYVFTPSGVAAVQGEAGAAFSAKLKLIVIVTAWGLVLLGIHRWFGEALRAILPA